MTKYIFFDLDGTLTDSQKGILRSLHHALEFYGIGRSDDELKKYIGPPLLETFERGFGFSREKAADAVAKYREYYAEKGIFESSVYDGIPELLSELQNTGRRLAVATSKPEEFAVRICEKFQIARYFDCICGSRMDETRSRKAEVIAYALERCGQEGSRENVTMVGDRSNDIQGAQANKIRSVGVLFGYGSRKELTDAGADFLAETVADLRTLLLER